MNFFARMFTSIIPVNLFVEFFQNPGGTPIPPTKNLLLMESGDKLLLENGNSIEVDRVADFSF